MKPHLTAVHCYTLTNPNGQTQWLLINGGYCDYIPNAQVEAEHPGWTVTDRTWRSDWTHLAAPGNSQPHYQDNGPGHTTPSQPPWTTSSEPLAAQAA